MIYYREFLKIPGPADLEMSHSNDSMASEFFRNNDTEYTWEEYYAYIEKEYPVKYFIASTLPRKFKSVYRTIKKPFADAHYWLVSHLIPSRRYHMLDLRQPENEVSNYDCYGYGWRDVDNRMLYAIFNLLDEYVTKEMPYTFIPSQEEADKDDGVDYNYGGFKAQRERKLEMLAIHKWWTQERKEEARAHAILLADWSEARANKDPQAEELWKQLNKSEEDFENKTDEMIARLMKVRRGLWS